MSGRYNGFAPPPAPQSRAGQVVAANGDYYGRQRNPLHAGEAEEFRRVQAGVGGYGVDINGKYDATGKNQYSTASNPWAAFFGAPAQPWKTSSYDQYDRHNYNLPEAYEGKSIMLEQTVDELIYSDENYYTRVLMPFRFTDQTSVTWDKWVFNQHFTGLVPEQGVSRLVSSTKEQQSDSFLRHGLAAIFEHGFMSTEQGRANYFLTLSQIARAVMESIHFGVIYAYLTCQNYTKQWQQNHGYFRKQNLKEILERENFMWAIAVKAEWGLEKLDAMIVEWMADHGHSADTWLIPPKPAIFLRLVPIEKTHYYIAGEHGPDNVNSIIRPGRPHEANAPNKRTQDAVEPYAMMKNNYVYLTRTYNLDDRGGPLDLMSRRSTVGEYFKITPSLDACDYMNGFMTCHSNRRIYDENNDCGYTTGMSQAVRYSQLFGDDGTPVPIPNNVNPIDAADLKQCFFVRSDVDTISGNDIFEQIDYLGEIDSAFLRPEDAANIARTAIAASFPDKMRRDEINSRLVAGQRRINELANAPIRADTLNGLTSWRGLNTAAAQADDVIAKFVGAINSVSEFLGQIFGGNDNLFLNPKNALPMYGNAGTTAQVIYENLFNWNSVPLWRVVDGGENVAPSEAQTAVFAQAYRNALAGVSATKIRNAKLTEAQETTLRIGLPSVDAPPTRANIAAALKWLTTHPQYTSAKDQTQLQEFASKIEAAIDQAERVGQQGARAGRRAFVTGEGPELTDYAVNVNSDYITSGQYLRDGYVMSSPFNIAEPRAGGIYDTDVNVIPTKSTLVAGAVHFESTPIMRALINARPEAGSVPSRKGKQQRQQQSSFGGIFDDDGDDDAHIGQMFGGGADQNRAVGDLDAHRRFIPQVGGINLNSDAPANIRFGTIAHNFDLLSKLPLDAVTRVATAIYYGARWHASTINNMLENNVQVPFGAIGARIGQYDMALGIKCKAGAETGVTYFGHSNFLLADDASVKVHYGHYTHYGKSVVHRAENVFIAYDIFPNRCLGGMGVEPYEHPSQFSVRDQLYTRDIFFMLVAYREEHFDKVMSLAGRFYTFMDAGMLDDEDPSNRALHYSTAAFYNRIWGWYNEDEIVIELDEPLYRMNNPTMDLTIWQGAQGSWSPNGKFDKDIIRNKSPWGPNVAEGSRNTRNGMMERQQIVPIGVLGF